MSIRTANKGFKLISLDTWTSNNDGARISQAQSQIRFRGTLAYDQLVVETVKTISPTDDIPAKWVKNITFKGTPLDNAVLSFFEIIIESGDNFVSFDNFKYAAVGTDPEMEIRGQSNIRINSGVTGATPNNATSFGSPCADGGISTRNFTIRNLASYGKLNLGSISIIENVPGSGFKVGAEPVNIINAVELTTFSITFDPASGGLKAATVSIPNNDLDENPFTFVISGTGIATPDVKITAGAPACRLSPLTLSVSSAGTGARYNWSGNGVVATNSASITANPTASGNQRYQVIVTNSSVGELVD